MEIRKVFKTGSSLVVAIPPEYLKCMDLKLGEKVLMFIEADNNIKIQKMDEQSLTQRG